MVWRSWCRCFEGGRRTKRTNSDDSSEEAELQELIAQPLENEETEPDSEPQSTGDDLGGNQDELSLMHASVPTSHDEEAVKQRILLEKRIANPVWEPPYNSLFQRLRRGNTVQTNTQDKFPPIWRKALTSDYELATSSGELKIDINTRKFGRTPLHSAVYSGRTEEVKRLISAHPELDLDKVDDNGATPLHMALKQSQTEASRLFIESGGDYTTVSSKVSPTQTEIVTLLIEAGANLNRGNEFNQTPLTVALRDCDDGIARVLVKAHVDYKPTDKACRVVAVAHLQDGNSRLHAVLSSDSVLSKPTKLVKLLIELQADVNQLDKDGRTLLHAASMGTDTEATKLLIDAHADINATDSQGRTALHLASNATTVRLLLDAGASVEARDHAGWTPLHCACVNANAVVVHGFLEAGSTTHATDNDGYHALHLLLFKAWCDQPWMAMLMELVAYGVKWDATCTQIAAQSSPWPSTMPKRPSDEDNERWAIQAPALRACVFRWMEEHEHGLPPMSIAHEQVRKGIVATETYIKEIAESKEVVYRRKICVVGPSNWGKTSLIKSLTMNEPSLVHSDDRTIGIDHFKMAFEEDFPSLQTKKKHEVTFWDFAGQDAYQVAHSLFFSARTLYLVCIDLESYVIARMQADLMTEHQSQADKWMNEFLGTRVLRWIRLIFARQPDAEFVFVATKKDRVTDRELLDTDGALADLSERLKNIMVIVEDLKHGTTAQAQSPSTWDFSDRKPIRYLGDPRLERLRRKPAASIIVSSCSALESVETVKKALQDAIIKSDRGFPMPEKYSHVLKILLQMRHDAAQKTTDLRLLDTFAKIKTLKRKLQNHVEVPENDAQDARRARRHHYRVRMMVDSGRRKPFLDKRACVTILQTLRDLGDVLWYDDVDDEAMRNTVILDPLLLIDFVRQIINHKHTAETMPHAKLKGLPFWVSLQDGGMLFMKRVLQHFSLVHPTYGEMKATSDLIVPGYWKTNTCAFWKFGGDILRLGRSTDESELAVRVHWEFHFENEFPDSLFDNLVITSYAATYTRDVGPDWILYERENTYACRVMLGRDNATHQRSLHLEALLSHSGVSHANALWVTFKHMAGKLERILHSFPGLCVTSLAWNRADTQHDLESVLASPVSPDCETWMPPAASWQEFQSLAV